MTAADTLEHWRSEKTAAFLSSAVAAAEPDQAKASLFKDMAAAAECHKRRLLGSLRWRSHQRKRGRGTAATTMRGRCDCGQESFWRSISICCPISASWAKGYSAAKVATGTATEIYRGLTRCAVERLEKSKDAAGLKDSDSDRKNDVSRPKNPLADCSP